MLQTFSLIICANTLLFVVEEGWRLLCTVEWEGQVWVLAALGRSHDLSDAELWEPKQVSENAFCLETHTWESLKITAAWAPALEILLSVVWVKPGQWEF